MNRTMFAALVAIASSALADTGTPQSAKPEADKEKRICRREVPIGSLIASRKVCLTKAEWTKRADDGNEEARRFLENFVCEGNGKC